jgi:hypothetical protein
LSVDFVIIDEFMAVDFQGKESEVRRITPIRRYSDGHYRLAVKYLPPGQVDAAVYERMRKVWWDLLEREGVGRDW